MVLTNWDTPFRKPEPIPALCSEYAKFFVALCQQAHIQSRVVWMDGHTTAEIWCDGQPFIVDPNGNVILRGPQGELLSVADLAAGIDFKPEELLPRHLGGGDDPNFIGTPSMHVYESPPLAVEIFSPHLFNFHLRTRHPVLLLGTMFGGKPAAQGLVLTEGNRTPVGRGPSILWLAILAFSAQLGLGTALFLHHRRTHAEE